MTKTIPELVRLLNYYTQKYDEGHPEISDKEWDEMFFELIQLEKEAGYFLQNSPTQRITYDVVNKLEKVEHNHKMLSLDKTKSIQEVVDFLGDKQVIAMCKMDGLTCSLHYKDGKLVGAETRGNGLIGENILHNAQVLKSIPTYINYYNELIIDGEIISTYNNFEKFNTEYKNPRNFAAGSIRVLDSKECAARNLKFVAWDIIKGLSNHITHENPATGERTETRFYISYKKNEFLGQKLFDLAKLGFVTVPYFTGTIDSLLKDDVILKLQNEAKEFSYPIDGLVFKFNDIEYGQSLGETAHHFKNAIAYKFYDETYDTILRDIEWSMGRTGVITPIAIFDPVEIDGSIIERCSLFNLSVLEEKLGKPYIGQKLQISKRNMIIPYIEKAEKLS